MDKAQLFWSHRTPRHNLLIDADLLKSCTWLRFLSREVNIGESEQEIRRRLVILPNTDVSGSQQTL